MKTMRVLMIAAALVACTSVWATAQDRDDDNGRVQRDRHHDRRGDRDRDRDRDHDRRWRRDNDDRGRYNNRVYQGNGNYYPYRGDGDADDNRGTYYPYGSGSYYPYGNGAYGNYGYGTYGNVAGTAQQWGYQDGVADGVRDAQVGRAFNPADKGNFKHANRGYNRSMGDVETYRSYYRAAFEQGYRQGYSQNAGYGYGWRR